MENVVQIEDMCRICGTSTSGLVRHPIFEDENSDLSSKILSCLPVVIIREDLLPKFVCGECEYKVSLLHDLRAVSLKTDELLKSLLSVDNPIKIEKIISAPENEATEPDIKYSVDQVQETLVKPQVFENCEHITLKKHSTSLIVDVVIPNKETINESPAVESRKRPIRAVRLNTEISYASDSILENLLKKSPSVKKVKAKKSNVKQCKYCKLLMPSREYPSHLTDEHKKQFECNLCKNRFSNSEELEEHKEVIDHSEPIHNVEAELKGVPVLKCNMCQKTYLRKHLLVLHMRKHTGERPFPCNLCERKYACKSSLNSHLLKHKEQWKHVCNFCGKGFVDKHSFVYHVRSNHTGERPFACDKCERKFIKKQDLLKHLQTQHSEYPKEAFSCEKCGKVCKDYDSLRSHRRSHIPVEERRVHKCTLCEASFTGKTGLMKHMHRHTGEMPYECEQCSKRFFTKKGLELHLVIHSGVKSFICEFCGRTFSQDNTLKVHRRTHTGERPYQCSICLKRFTQSSALNSHKKLHLKD